jgi:hypothetical protein
VYTVYDMLSIGPTCRPHRVPNLLWTYHRCFRIMEGAHRATRSRYVEKAAKGIRTMPKVRLAHLVRQFQSPRIGVCVLVALHVGAALLLQNMAPSIRLPFSSALVKCEVGLLSWWVVLGPSNVVLALSGWVAGMTALLALSIHPFLPVHSGLICLSDAAEFDWAMTLHDCDVIAVLSSPALLVCFFVIERLRWMIRETDSVVCLGRPARSARQLVRRSQFSVGDCLLFLTVVAGSLSVAATLQPYPGWLLDWYKVVQVYILDSH